jgi:amidase
LESQVAQQSNLELPKNARTAGPQISDIVMMDSVALSDAIRMRKISCVEAMTAYLDHIGRLNPKVNAIVALQNHDALMCEARESDAALLRRGPIGPLHGLPQAIKDLQPVKGIVTTSGSPILKDFVPTADGIMAERMRKAGAIFIGKTNVPEFGLGSNTYNPVYGITRNAYDQSRSAGGSSGGAAVALALRMLPVADGTDVGGSLRNPAGWNNVFGFRTSYGRVPADGRDIFLPSMGVIGPMARNVPDLAMLLAVQAGYDARVPLSMESDGSALRGALERDFKGTRIAWTADFGGNIPYEPGVMDVCKRALKSFENLGCFVEEAAPAFSVDAVWQAMLITHYRDPEKRAVMKPEAIYEVESALKLSALDIAAASAVRTEWYHAVRRFFETYDFLIVPTAQMFPFDANIDWPKEIAGNRMQTYHEWMKCVMPVTMAGVPALAAPAGFNDAGMPIGIQIVGKNHAELACLQLCLRRRDELDAAAAAASRRARMIAKSCGLFRTRSCADKVPYDPKGRRLSGQDPLKNRNRHSWRTA